MGNSAQQVLLSRDSEKAAACAKKTTPWTTCTGSCSPTPRAIVPEKSERVARQARVTIRWMKDLILLSARRRAGHTRGMKLFADRVDAGR